MSNRSIYLETILRCLHNECVCFNGCCDAMRCDVMNKYHHIGGCRQLQKCCQEIASSRLHPHRKQAIPLILAHQLSEYDCIRIHFSLGSTRLDSTRYMHRTDPLGNYDNLDACALVTRPCTSWNCRFTLTNPPVSAFRRSSPINKPIFICRKKAQATARNQHKSDF